MIRSCLAVSAIVLALSALPATSQGIPKAGEQFAALSKDAMYTWYAEPKAIYYEGVHKRTYMAWNSSTGTKGIAYYDHDTKDTVVTTLPKVPYGADDHNHPAIIMRPDGKLMVFCTGHDGGEITEFIAKNPEDISAWEPASYPAKNSWFCYPNAMFLKSEADSGRFYLFFRDSLLEPWFTTSDDWGKTWKNPRYHLFHVSTYPNDAYKPYVKYASNGIDQIQIVIERQNREGDASRKPVYFAKYKNGNFYQDDGRLLGGLTSLPLLDTQLDTIFYASRFGCSNTCYDVALDSNNNAVIVMDMFKDTTINIYWYMHWTGTKWFKKPMVNSGAYRGAQSGFAAGITLDHENPSNVYLCRQMLKPTATAFNLFDTSYTNYKNNLKPTCWTTPAHVHELEKWTTKDWGATWDTIPITRNSATTYMNTNCLPCVPRNHKAGTKLEVLWLNGLYQSMSPDAIGGYPGYQMSLRMFPFKDGEQPTTGVQAPRAKDHAAAASGIRMVKNVAHFSLVKPQTSTLKVFGLDGKLIADETAALHALHAGPAQLSLPLINGAYVMQFDNGQGATVKTLMVSK